MGFLLPSKELLERRIQAVYMENGFDSVLTPGTVEYAMAKSLADELYNLYNQLENVYNSTNLSTASGKDLDLIGELVGLKRNQATYAYSAETDMNVVFYIKPEYRDTDDFDTLNISEIPSGTLVSTADGLNFTVGNSILYSDPHLMYVSVTAVMPGAEYNVDAGQLIKHNLSANPSLSSVAHKIGVINRFAITGGASDESDEAFRYRISQAFASNMAGNKVAVLTAIRSMPEISDAFVVDNVYGTGTFGVFIIPTFPVIAQSLINKVQETIDIVKPVGTKGYVLYPEYKAVKLNIEIVPSTKSFTSMDVMKDTLASYINNLKLGETLYTRQLENHILSYGNVDSVIIKSIEIGEYDPKENSYFGFIETEANELALDAQSKWVSATSLIDICLTEA